MIRVGLYRATIEVQRPPAHVQFQAPAQWETIKRLRARRIEQRGTEAFENSGIVGQGKIGFEVRFFQGLTTSHRIVQGNEVFDISSFENLRNKNRKLIIWCTYATNRENRGA